MDVSIDPEPTLATILKYINDNDENKFKFAFHKYQTYQRHKEEERRKKKERKKTSNNLKTLIKCAVEANSNNIVQFLVDNGAHENSVLDSAIACGNENIVKLAIDCGANVDEGLYHAIKTQNAKIIDLLIKLGGNINANYKNGNTPLHIAVTKKCVVDFIRFLIDNQADCNVRNKNNKKALDLLQPLLLSETDGTAKENLQLIQDLLETHTLIDNRYHCEQGLPDGLNGYNHQMKYFTLSAIINTRQAACEDYRFELATEVKYLGPFDDIYLKKTYNGQTSFQFIQIKQTKKPYQNKMKRYNFFVMLNPEKDIRKHLKDNTTIMNMFMKFNEICDSTLYKATVKDFIYCTNMTFQDTSSSLFSESPIDNSNSWGIGKQKWQIKENKLLLWEIKFVLLNVLSVSKYVDMMDKGVKYNIDNQTILMNTLSVDNNETKHFADSSLWSVSKIVAEGLRAIDKYLQYLDSSEKNKDLISYTESTKDKELFLHFSHWDDGMIETRINDFKRDFSIYTDCLSNDKLKNKIAAEINEEFKYHNSMLLSDYCENYMTKWVTRFKNGLGQFFSNEDGKQLFDYLREIMTKELSQSYVESLQVMNINFKHDHERLLEFIKCTNKNILHVITEHAHLNSIKIYQTFKRLEKQEPNFRPNERVFFINADFFIKHKNISNILYAFSSTINYNILFIEFPHHFGEYNTFYNVFDGLTNILKNNPKKKIIIVAKSDNILAVQLKHQFNQNISYSEYIGFNDLAHESQKRLLSKSVCFSEGIPRSQGKELKFKDFLNLDLACEIVDEDLLTKIISEENIVEFRNSNAFKSDVYNKEYYIPRKLLVFSITFLTDFLKKNYKILIFVTGITKEELISKATVREDVIHLWEDGKKIDANISIIIMSDRKEYTYETNKTTKDVFTRISNKCPKNIHWFEFRGNLFYWKMANVKQNNSYEGMFKTPFPFLSPENLNKKLVILANHPGEGKSTMLTDLAHALMKENFDLWILRINLKDYAYGKVTPSLDDINFSAEETSKAIDMFTLMAIQGDNKDLKIKLERKLLEIALNGNSKTQIVLLFDGFDEISPDYKEKGCVLIKSLSKTNIRHIWVTTRVQMKTYLEEHLGIPACTLAPLNKEQQVQFLNRFFIWHLKNYKHSQDTPNNGRTIFTILKHLEIIRKYCVNCIDGHNFSFLVLRITERRYRTLINLYKAIDHLDLSVFSETALQLFKRSILDTKDFTKSPLNLKLLAISICRYNYDISNLDIVGLFDIYTQFVKETLEIYHEEKRTTGRDNQTDNDLTVVVANTTFSKMHRELAVKSLFRTLCDLPELNVCNEFQNIHEKLTRIGLVKNHENSLQFLHCSYAGFYFAEYLSNHLENINVQLEFLGNILINDDYHLIRIFFNGFLAQMENTSSNRKSQTMNSRYRFQSLLSERVLKEILNKENSQKEGALHVATRCGLKQICLIIFENIKVNIRIFKNFIMKRNAKGQTVLHLAACNINSDTFDTIMEYVKQCPSTLESLVIIPDNEGQTALYVAADSGNTNICSSILDEVVEYPRTFKVLILKTIQNGQTVLHAAARRNVELCKVILQASKKHPDVIKGLMMQLDSNDKTALHTAAQSNFTEIYELFFQYFEEYPDIFKELIKMWKFFQHPLLHIASRIVNKQFCRIIVELIKEDPTTMIYVLTSDDKAGRTILHEVTRQDNEDIFNLIITYATEYSDGFDNMIITHDEQNDLQCITTQDTDKTPSNILKFLITKPDNNGDTILHIAAHQNIKIFHTILQTIVEYPSMFNDLIMKLNNEGQSIIHLAALNHNKYFCDTILLKIQNRPDLLRELLMKDDDKGQSALHVAVAKDDQKFCNLICDRIQNYYDLLKDLLIKCDKEGQSILHVAARRHHKYMCNTICDKLKNHPVVLKQLIMKCDNKGQNILHLATLTNNTSFCDTICDKMISYPDLLQELFLKSNNEGQCVLYLAVSKSDTILYNKFYDAVQNHPDVFKELLMKCNENGQSVLHVVARDQRKQIYDTVCDKFSNHPKLFERLLLKCDNEGQSVLHVAVQTHNIYFFDVICDKVKNKNGLFKEILLTCDNKGQTVLHIAAQDCNKNFYDTILTKVINNYDLFREVLLICDNNGQSVLHVAAGKHNHDFCYAICNTLRNHPDLLKELLLKSDRYGFSVLHVAALVDVKLLYRFVSIEDDDVQNVKECCDIIADNIRAHPDVLKELLMMRNLIGETALHIAICEEFHLRFKVMLETAQKCPEIFEELIMTCNNRGQTILHVVAETGNKKIAQILLSTLDKQPDVLNNLVIVSDKDGKTALCVAEENNHIEVREMISQISNFFLF